MSINCIRIVLLLTTILSSIGALRILINSPAISRSHIISNGRLADVLVAAGHQVVIFIPEIDPSIVINGSKLGINIRQALNNLDRYTAMNKEMQQHMFGKVNIISGVHMLFKFLAFGDMLTDVCQEMIQNRELIDRLRAFNFDIVFSEQYDSCGVGIAHMLGIRTHLWLSSCPMMEIITSILGVDTPLSYVPTINSDYTDQMSYTQRVGNLIQAEMFKRIMLHGFATMTAMFRRHFGVDFPSTEDLFAQSALVFVNSEELIDFPRPILHKIIYIGGLGLEQAKPLTTEIDRILATSKSGGVLFSWGTIVRSSSMPEQLKVDIFDAFAEFNDYVFIFKISHDDNTTANLLSAKRYRNIHLLEWVPQVDILADNRLKAFITHGGQNSLLEAAYAGVPLIIVPFFADQFHNGQSVQRQGFGYQLLRENINKDSMKKAIDIVLHDKSYTENAQRIARMIAKKPFRPEQLLVKWTEFAGEFGSLPELDIYGRQLSFVTYYMLDVFVPFVLIAVIVLLGNEKKKVE